ncbi:MAG TPA: prephenate dehydrogenase [Gemmatimonadaceae bacterium]|nr:prephenate dehydrogenase [Gemmatimonadaceae bacterium]
MSDATRVAIVGLGGIGGSAALKLGQRGASPIGYASDDADRRGAVAAGLRVADSLRAAVTDVDLVLIAVPLDQVAPVVEEVLAAAPGSATVLHAAGLQRPHATRLAPAAAGRVIGTHPLAGTELSGFGAASADLFLGATVYVEPRGTRRMREDAELFWSMAGAKRIEYRDAADHDDLMAAVSHVPQLVATALGATLAYSNIPRALLGPGGRDMTRLAASPWSMWKPLLGATPGRTLAMLESIETELRDIREEIAKGTLDEAAISWSVARGWALEKPRDGEPAA